MSTTYAILKAVANVVKFLEKPAQSAPVEAIGDGKNAALKQLFNIFIEKKVITHSETVPNPSVNNSIPESAPR